MKKKKILVILLAVILCLTAMPFTAQAGWKKDAKGNSYYYNSKGVLQKNKWIGRRYVDSTGKWLKNRSVVEKSKYANKLKQIVIVQATGNKAYVSLHQRASNGKWTIPFKSSGYVGSRGVGKTREGDYKTPSGMFTMTKAFGILKNPGIPLKYSKVNNSHYWVTDSSSKYYNRPVSTRYVKKDWDEAEHLIDYNPAYRYAIAIDYNTKRVPGKGSAIFLHCSTGGPTAGCVSIPEGKLRQLMKMLRPGARIAIGTGTGLDRLLGIK